MIESVIIAAIGGLIYNIFPFLEYHSKPIESRPDFRDIFFWIPFFIVPLLGAFLAYIYQTPETPLSKWVSFHVGLSAPVIIRQAMQSSPFKPKQIKLQDENQ